MTWYLNVLAFGGQIVDANGQPLFEDPNSGGYKAFEFYINALHDGLIDPAVASMTGDQQGQYWRSGKAAVTYAAPGDFVSNDDPTSRRSWARSRPCLCPALVVRARATANLRRSGS